MALMTLGHPSDAGGTRPPAVAGQFYAKNAAELRADVNRYLNVKPTLPTPPVMLISPHAGYIYSAPLAGRGFAEIDRATNLVILIGPSHHVYFTGVSIPDVDSFETPLGRVPLAGDLIATLRRSPLVTADPRAHAREHCLEVQLPFLQTQLPSFRIIPIVTGKVDPAEVAALLFPLVGKNVLVVASSDLSHYSPHEQAREIDKRTIATIMSGDAGGFLDACGETAIRVALHLAPKLGLSPALLDARDSYETAPASYKDPSRVVGYASIAFVNGTGDTSARKPVSTDSKAGPTMEIPGDTRHFLLKLARSSLEAGVRGMQTPRPNDVPSLAREKCGCFVTLTKGGQLRGCVGYLVGVKPLFEAVIDMAQNAALQDTRFSPVAPEELADIRVEISVLTPPVALPFTSPEVLLAKLVPKEDGLILKSGRHQSTFLPQVWEQLPDKVQFLQHLSTKGGMPVDGWKTAQVQRYRAIHFAEE